MLRMWHVFAGVKTADQLSLPVPALAPRPADGQRAPETATVEPAADLAGYVTELGRRAEQIRNRAVRAEEDNMLKVSGDGRRAALDLRLVRQLAAAAREPASSDVELQQQREPEPSRPRLPAISSARRPATSSARPAHPAPTPGP